MLATGITITNMTTKTVIIAVLEKDLFLMRKIGDVHSIPPLMINVKIIQSSQKRKSQKT